MLHSPRTRASRRLLPAAAAAALLGRGAPAQDAEPAAAPGPATLIRFEPGVLTGELAASLELDIASHDGVLSLRGANEVVAWPGDLAALDGLGLPYTLVQPDLEAFYRSRLVPGGLSPAASAGGYGAWLSPPFASGGMGGYYTFAEIESVLDQIHAAYPNLTTAKASIGTTLEGRTQWMMKISDNPNVDENEPEVRYDALHHAREPQGMQTTLWFMLYLLEEYGSDPAATYIVNTRELYFIPCVNPDGYEYNRSTNPGGGGLWRKNRRNNGGGVFGVDLNRNYEAFWGYDNIGSSPTPSSDTYRGPSPASEPEVANMQAFIASREFATAQSNHTYSNLWLYPYGYDAVLPANSDDYVEVSALATAENGYAPGPAATALYPANGVTFDYDHEVHGTMGWTPEIGSSSDGFWPPTSRIVPLAEENVSAFLTTAFAAGPFIRPDVSFDEMGDGDGFVEAGEGIVFPRLRNSGMGASGAVSIALTSSSPFASVSVAGDTAPSVASFSDFVSLTPVRLDVVAGTPGGTAIPYDLTVTYAGYAQSFSGQVVVGELRPFLVDTLEIDRGWTAGLPGDDATTGLWVRGDPIGTFNGSEAINPEDDASPGGVNAFMTGNGGGSAGTDDVDGGVTTLLSPLFDLSGVQAARLSYQRWYALFTSLDDVLEVSISPDAGSSWTTLELLSTSENAWTEVTHELNGLVPFTDRMQLRVIAGDLNSGSLVEAALDDVRVEVYDAAPRLNFYGPVTAGGTVQMNVSGQPGSRYIVQFSTGVTATQVGGGAASSGYAWNRLLPGQSSPLTGGIGATGLAQVDFQVPASPGTTLYYRVVTRGAGQPAVSNAAKLVIP